MGLVGTTNVATRSLVKTSAFPYGMCEYMGKRFWYVFWEWHGRLGYWWNDKAYLKKLSKIKLKDLMRIEKKEREDE